MQQDLYLQHYGVLGMHWGIRRYQNKDGSLTPRGKKHAAKLVKHQIKATSKAYNRNNPSSPKGSTGKNWDAVYEQNKAVAKKDKEANRYLRKAQQADRTAMKAGIFTPKFFKYLVQTQKYRKQYLNRRSELGKQFMKKYDAALIKDLGYTNTKNAQSILNDYNIHNQKRYYVVG